jgi:hypothetical protein
MASFIWNDYLKLAKILMVFSNPSTQEASLRSAVSRAYYAAFITARNFARDKRHLPLEGRTSDHFKVINFFHNSNPRIDRELKQLKEFRELCDYEDHVDNLEKIAEDAIIYSERIIAKFSS